MNRWEKEVQQSLLDSEEAALKELEKQYERALKDINENVKGFQTDIDLLDQALSQDGLDDATKALLKSQKQSKIYQKQYQQALKGQVSSVLDKLQGDNYATIDEYLKSCYETGYIGTMYDIAKQGVPIIAPIDQAAAVKAILTDSKIVEGYYNHLGVNYAELKKTITQEISRGIASGLPYSDIARNINNVSGSGLSNAKRIARTEGHRIQQTSSRDAQYAAKKKGCDVVKQWDSTLDGRTRDSHARVDGELRELDEEFSNGLMFPGDPSGSAAEVINCRCTSNTRARWALDDGELQTLQERAEYFGLDKTKNFEEYREKYLDVSGKIVKAEADNPVKNKFGDTIIFDEKLNKEKWKESVDIIKQLSEEYDTRLYGVTVGAKGAAGSVDMGGLMRLSSNSPHIAFHEFGHTLANTRLQKYGVTDDEAFWKEIKAVRSQYRKAVGNDSSLWISTYEHGNITEFKVDEFLCEAFAQAKMARLGIPLPNSYGRDLTYSNKVLDIVDKYFSKSGHSVLENATKIGIIDSDLRMLIEKDIAKQNSRQLKKGIASYQKQIEAHTAKISSPASYVPDWDSYTEKHQAGLVRHWQKEISFFQRSIDDRIAELKNRGDYNE